MHEKIHVVFDRGILIFFLGLHRGFALIVRSHAGSVINFFPRLFCTDHLVENRLFCSVIFTRLAYCIFWLYGLHVLADVAK